MESGGPSSSNADGHAAEEDDSMVKFLLIPYTSLKNTPEYMQKLYVGSIERTLVAGHFRSRAGKRRRRIWPLSSGRARLDLNI
jgi:hypothetical protein